MPTGMTVSERDLRLLMLYEHRLGLSEEEAATRINEAVGEGRVAPSTLRPWFQRFQTGNYSLEDEPSAEEHGQKRKADEEELGQTSSKRPAPLSDPMRLLTPPTFNLDTLDDFYLKRIVKMFPLVAGVRFYRSCKRVKQIVDGSKAIWRIPRLIYCREKRRIENRNSMDFYTIVTNFSAEQFLRVDKVDVYLDSATFIKEVVTPELEAMGSVGRLEASWLLDTFEDEDVRLLLAAAKPDAFFCSGEIYNSMFRALDNARNLEIAVYWSEVQSYSTARRVFEIGINRKTLLLDFDLFCKEIISSFIEKWRRGESTGSLEKFTMTMSPFSRNVVAGEAETHRAEIQNMLAKFEMPEGHIVERYGRRDRRRMRLDVDLRPGYYITVVFHFL